jgi:hypothetical protein
MVILRKLSVDTVSKPDPKEPMRSYLVATHFTEQPSSSGNTASTQTGVLQRLAHCAQSVLPTGWDRQRDILLFCLKHITTMVPVALGAVRRV